MITLINLPAGQALFGGRVARRIPGACDFLGRRFPILNLNLALNLHLNY